MTDSLFVKCICTLILSVMLGAVAFSRYGSDLYNDNPDQQRYLPYLNGLLLPTCMISICVVGTAIYGFQDTFESILPMCFSIFAHISFYYIFLLLLKKPLQKYLCARSCAMLWILPNYLYVIFNRTTPLATPKFVLYISKTALWVLSAIWFAGFIAVITHAYIQHFQFRKEILKDAADVTDVDVRRVWDAEIVNARIKKPHYKLLVSQAVTAPLSIGFFRKTILVVLPHTRYTSEELALIFRHELIHISRGDSSNKFFMVFCKAMCWFNPLMWMGMKRGAEDMELSCDETVLIDSNDETRKAYASLLLNSAQDSRGFTTCLASSAASVRYRLKNIIAYKDKNTGVILIAIISFIMLMTCGQIALTFDRSTVREEVTRITGITSISYDDISGTNFISDGQRYGNHDRNDEALIDYIMNLNIAKMNGNYEFSQGDDYLLIIVGSDASFAIEMNPNIMKIVPLGKTSNPTKYYHVQDDIDWSYLASLL